MNDFQDLYVRGLLIIDMLQTSRAICWLKEVRKLFSNSWLLSHEPSLLAVITRRANSYGKCSPLCIACLLTNPSLSDKIKDIDHG